MKHPFQSKFPKTKYVAELEISPGLQKEVATLCQNRPQVLNPSSKKKRLDPESTFSTKKATQPQMVLIYSALRTYGSNKKFPDTPSFRGIWPASDSSHQLGGPGPGPAGTVSTHPRPVRSLPRDPSAVLSAPRVSCDFWTPSNRLPRLLCRQERGHPQGAHGDTRGSQCPRDHGRRERRPPPRRGLDTLVLASPRASRGASQQTETPLESERDTARSLRLVRGASPHAAAPTASRQTAERGPRNTLETRPSPSAGVCLLSKGEAQLIQEEKQCC